jgi:23S rRNA pseudouridine1911/1915/1917 synthase
MEPGPRNQYSRPVVDWHVFDYTGTAGERCDAAVTLHMHELPEFADLSRARVQVLIDQGGVLVDTHEVPRAQKNLRPGMQVSVNLSLLRELIRPPAPADIEPVDIPLDFLHVDEHLAVVVKPAGLTVHPAPTEDGPTLTAALLHHFGQLSDAGGADRPGIVHRLDKETSGLLVVARDNLTHAALSRQFASRLVEKEYQALVLDPPEQSCGSIELPIERHPYNRQKMWTGGLGRPAHSEYRLAADWGALALLDVAIHTGRTHQIRVHLLSIGCSILSDDKYGSGRNGGFRKYLREGMGSVRTGWRETFKREDEARRQALLTVLEEYPGIFLHARRLAFTHPAGGARLEFECPWPPAWKAVAELCGKPEEAV